MRILLVDDHALFRSGLANLLEAWGETIAGSVGRGQEALELARALRPDLVLMDVNLPDMSGFEATLLIKAEMPRTRIIMLTAYAEADYVARSMRNGADGYLLKDTSDEALHQALYGPFSPEVTPTAAEGGNP
jgi:two-component system nitrate/nitrite response regulator NarL